MVNKHKVLLGALLLGVGLGYAHASSLPLTITADHWTVTNKTGQAVYSGHVVITRGAFEVRGNRAVVHVRNQKVSRIVVTGAPARFQWHPNKRPPARGAAQQITYLAANNLIELSGNVEIHRRGQTIQAPRMRYALSNGTLNARQRGSQRVKVVLPAASSTASGL